MARVLVNVLVIFVIVATYTVAQRHNWSAGYKQKGDYFIHRELVQNLTKRPNRVISRIVWYPKNVPRREIIHFINCTDNYYNGTGGFVKIIGGGVGFNYVTLNFTSMRGGGINYNLDIWGR